MRILHTISPLGYHVEENNLGGTEQIAYLLDKGLLEKGYSSNMIARRGSQLYNDHFGKRLIPLLGDNIDIGRCSANQIQFLTAIRCATELEEAQSGKYDIIHSHSTDIMRFGKIIPIPIVTTLHFPIEWYWNPQVLGQCSFENNHFVAISESQRKAYCDLGYEINHVIYNGVDTRLFPFGENKMNYILSLGRISQEKGHDIAIQIAKKLGINLVIAGCPSNYQEDEKDFQQIIGQVTEDWSKNKEKLLQCGDLANGSNRIIYFGAANNEEKKKLFAYAKAFLAPIKWEEPFGLALIEAMVCGTPVIAFNRGAVPEIVLDGETGYIVDTIEEMVQAVKQAQKISPLACRNHVDQKFSLERMVNGYVDLYKTLLG